MKTPWVSTPEALDDAVQAHLSSDEFVFDVETRGAYPLDPRRNEVFWIVLASHGRTDVIPCGHPVGEQIGTAKDPRLCKDGKVRQYTVPVFGPKPHQLHRDQVFAALKPLMFSDQRKIGHNVKFDLESVAKYYGGVMPSPPYGDTMGAAFLLNENLHQYSLAACVKRSFKVVLDKSITASLPQQPFKQAYRYTFRDGRYTWLLWRRLEPLLREQQLWKLFSFEMDVLEALLDMEAVGIMPIDEELRALDAELDEERVRLTTQLHQIVGRAWNFNSHPQKQLLFYANKKDGGQGLKVRKFTKSGAPSCDDEALSYHQGNPLVDTYRLYGDVERLSSTYVKAWLGREDTGRLDKKRNNAPPLNPDTGRIHANFKAFGTVTGRFSCSEPNLQNIPRSDTELGKRIRNLFCAAPGHILVVSDYSQIEYVVMAHYSRDPRLVKAFEEGLDFHLYVASMLLGIPMDQVTKRQRTLAKNTNFAVAYGAGDDKVASMSGVTFQEAQDFRATHRRMLPKLYQFTEDVVTRCRSRNPPHVRTLLGRRRRLPETFSVDRWRREAADRQAVNSVIQGSAADINKLALIRVNRLRDLDEHLLLNVHDELILEAPESKAEHALEVMREGMLGAGISDLLSVPLAADTHVVTRWGDAK